MSVDNFKVESNEIRNLVELLSYCLFVFPFPPYFHFLLLPNIKTIWCHNWNSSGRMIRDKYDSPKIKENWVRARNESFIHHLIHKPAVSWAWCIPDISERATNVLKDLFLIFFFISIFFYFTIWCASLKYFRFSRKTDISIFYHATCWKPFRISACETIN